MNSSDEAIEAAARAIEERLRAYPVGDGLSGAIGWGASPRELAQVAFEVIAARVRAEALREFAAGIAPNRVRPADVIVVGARMTEDVLALVRDVTDGLVAAVRAEAVAERWQPDGWGEGQEATDHPVNCGCGRCVVERLEESNDALRAELERASERIEQLKADADEAVVAEAVAAERQRIRDAIEAERNRWSADSWQIEVRARRKGLSEALTIAAGSVPVATPEVECAPEECGRTEGDCCLDPAKKCWCNGAPTVSHRRGTVGCRYAPDSPVATPTEPTDPRTDPTRDLCGELQASLDKARGKPPGGDDQSIKESASQVPDEQPAPWFRETPESLAMLEAERAEIAAVEAAAEQPEER